MVASADSGLLPCAFSDRMGGRHVGRTVHLHLVLIPADALAEPELLVMRRIPGLTQLNSTEFFESTLAVCAVTVDTRLLTPE